MTVSNSFSSINNLRIQTRLTVGFATLLVIVLVMGGMSYWQFVGINRQVDDYSEQVEMASIAARVEAEFLRFEGHVREYANTGSIQAAAFAREMAPDLEAHIAEGLATTAEPAVRAHFEEVSEAVESFLTDFHEVERLQEELHVLVDQTLAVDGARFLEDLDEMQRLAGEEGNGETIALSTVAREHALKSQLYTNMLLASQDDVHAEEARAEFALLEAALESLGNTLRTAPEREIFEELQALLLEYEEGFELVLEDRHALHRLSHESMVEAAEIIRTDTEWLQSAAAEAEERIRRETEGEIASAESLIVVLVVAGLIIGPTVALLIGGAISRPVVAMTGAMRELAAGDKSVDIPATGQKDEIGEMAKAVQVFKENMIKNEEMAAAAAAEEERRRVRAQRIDRLTADFDKSIKIVVDMTSSSADEMQATAQTMSSIAEETSSQATTVASAAEQASNNVQTVASAAEELSNSIEEIARQVQRQSAVATRADDALSESRRQVSELAEQAQGIGDVVGLITSIAEQTNLLALNATIEAARAGDAGKGFAIVASEVKTLATQTAKATEDIADQIKGVQERTGSTVSAIERITETIASMTEIASVVASAVEEQNVATQEIGRNVQEAATGTQQVSSAITGVRQASVEAGSASTQVLAAAGELSKQAADLSAGVRQFLDDVRAA